MVLAVPVCIFAENISVTGKTQQRLSTFQGPATIASILGTPISVPKVPTVTFKTSGCVQSKLQERSIYFLQVINDTVALPSNFVPKDLVNVTPHMKTWVQTPVCMTRDTATQLYRMMEDMSVQKLHLAVVSAYRSYGEQNGMFKNGAKTLNSGEFDRVAPAGQSEHQLGTAVDVSSLTKSGVAFATSSESLWLQENAHKYGFVISYTDGNQDKTGYMYEPWHIRYIGVDNAILMHEGAYTLSYKSTYYRQSWMQILLEKLQTYVQQS